MFENLTRTHIILIIIGVIILLYLIYYFMSKRKNNIASRSRGILQGAGRGGNVVLGDIGGVGQSVVRDIGDTGGSVIRGIDKTGNIITGDIGGTSRSIFGGIGGAGRSIIGDVGGVGRSVLGGTERTSGTIIGDIGDVGRSVVRGIEDAGHDITNIFDGYNDDGTHPHMTHTTSMTPMTPMTRTTHMTHKPKPFTLYNFYSPNCGASMNFIPIWNNLAKRLHNLGIIDVKAVDATLCQNENLAFYYNIKEYPTIILVTPNRNIEYSGNTANSEDIYKFVLNVLNEYR